MTRSFWVCWVLVVASAPLWLWWLDVTWARFKEKLEKGNDRR